MFDDTSLWERDKTSGSIFFLMAKAILIAIIQSTALDHMGNIFLSVGGLSAQFSDAKFASVKLITDFVQLSFVRNRVQNVLTLFVNLKKKKKRRKPFVCPLPLSARTLSNCLVRLTGLNVTSMEHMSRRPHLQTKTEGSIFATPGLNCICSLNVSFDSVEMREAPR